MKLFKKDFYNDFIQLGREEIVNTEYILLQQSGTSLNELLTNIITIKTLKQLKEEAKSIGIKGLSKFTSKNKNELQVLIDNKK